MTYLSSARTNPDPEPSDTLPGAGLTPRFDLLLLILLLSLHLLVFILVLVPPGGAGFHGSDVSNT